MNKGDCFASVDAVEGGGGASKLSIISDDNNLLRMRWLLDIFSSWNNDNLII